MILTCNSKNVHYKLITSNSCYTTCTYCTPLATKALNPPYTNLPVHRYLYLISLAFRACFKFNCAQL